MSFSPATLTLPNPGSDGTLFLTLSSHPGTNVTFALSSSNPDVATVPPSAPMPVGTTSLGLKVTAIGPGTTVIKASAPGFADATATVTVEQPGTLTMTANTTNVQLGQPATLTLTLSKPAPAQGTTITLTSSNPKIKVNPASAFIAAGGTTVTAQATGSNVGSGTISASAPGFTSPAPITINVGATIEWASPNTTIVGTGQQILLDLRLLHTVPGGPDFSPNDGIVINLTSSRPDVATVVPSVNFFWDGSSSPITRVQVNSVGAGTTTITASGINIPPVTLTVTVTGPIAITTPSLPNGTVGTPYSFTVAANGGVPPLHWTATGLPAGLSIDNASGHITGTPTAPSSGSVTITVADSSTPTALTATGTFTLTVTAPVPTSIAVSSGSNQSAGINTAFASPLKAIVKDVNNNPVSGVVVTFTAPASGASGSFAGGQTTATTDAAGIATSAVFTANGTVGSYGVTASAPGGLSTSFALTNTTGTLSIAVSSGSPQSAQINTAFGSPLAVIVKDSGNNPVSGVVVTFTAPGSGASGSFAGAQNTSTTNASGIATSAVFTANATVGSYAVVASVTGSTASFALTNTPGSVTTLTVVSGSPQSAPINTAFPSPLKVIAKDAGGNPVSGVVVTFSAPGSGASGTFAGGQNTATTDASGVATSAAFTANGTAGSYTVNATAGAQTAGFALTNTVGVPATIAVVSGSNQSTAINTAFASPLKVIVKDAGGNPISGVVVTFSAPGSGASGTFAGGQNTATTDASGIATSAVFTANGTAANYTVTATAGALTTSFTLTNLPGTGATIEVVSGSGQSAPINTPFASPLKVLVKDAGGNPVSGVAVQFTAPGSGASGTFASGQKRR